ncbi:PadR family transcriptional regulator [bacterium]|nr:PadR family transcriptional regulator [bacterium]
MAELTKLEEQILLSVWKLGDNAYGLTIYKTIVEITGKKMAIGGIYYPLERLVKKRFIDAIKGAPTAVRGGQAKRYYRLTTHGKEALMAEKKAHEAFWSGLVKLQLGGNLS